MMRGSFLSIIIQIMFSQQSPSLEDLKELYKLEKIHRLKLEQFQTQLRRQIQISLERKETKTRFQQLSLPDLQAYTNGEQMLSLAIGLVYIQSHSNIALKDIVQVK